jgi:hypothetical protein
MSVDTAPKLTRRRILAFAVETTTGTPASVAGTDAVTLVFGDVPIIKYATEQVEREPIGGLSQIQQAVGARSGTATFETELVGNGATGTAIWTRLLQACGYVNNAGVWSPIDGNTVTLTIAEWIDGRQRILSGCMGTFSIVCRRGQKARIRWNFTGVQQPPGDVANPTPTFVTTKAPRCGAASLTIDSNTALRMPEIAIDAGNDVILREDVGAVDSASNPTGYRAAYIVGRKPMVKVSPEALSYATLNWWTLFQNLTTCAFSTTIGSTSNNTWAIAAPAMQLIADPNDEDRNKMLATGLSFLCTRSSSAGLDELTLTQS